MGLDPPEQRDFAGGGKGRDFTDGGRTRGFVDLDRIGQIPVVVRSAWLMSSRRVGKRPNQIVAATVQQSVCGGDLLAVGESIVNTLDLAQCRLLQLFAARDVPVAQLEEDRAMRAVALEHDLLGTAVEPGEMVEHQRIAVDLDVVRRDPVARR